MSDNVNINVSICIIIIMIMKVILYSDLSWSSNYL